MKTVLRVLAVRCCIAGLACLSLNIACPPGAKAAAPLTQGRTPQNESDLRDWLENMVWYHNFSLDEIQRATGMTTQAVAQAMQRLNILPGNQPPPLTNATLQVLPYPGGRHPRIGFLDGAIDPQRETKISVFTPWDPESYVVLDIPEAIWSNLGLTYLAHTHIDTIWTARGVALPRLEWEWHSDGTLRFTRQLPNGIAFGTKVLPQRDSVLMEMWLANGTDDTLRDLRVQNCVMLKGAPEFNAQTNANKVLSEPYVACRNESGTRWIITAWQPCQRAWANPPVPCLHSDPQFPDCAPGQTQRLRGWLSFYTGTEVEKEFQRIQATGWDKRPWADTPPE